MKSFEAKISKALKPSKNTEKEKVKRKTVKDDSGSCGNGVTYEFVAETGTLTISKTGDGDGAMKEYDYYSNSAPWNSYKDSIQTVIIENGVTSIGAAAFYDCSGLTSVTIGADVKAIGSSAFSYCSGLTSFNVSENNPNYSSFGGILYSKDFTSIVLVPEGISGEITLHDDLTSIGSSAFSSCSGLTSVTIPDGVTSIEYSAFSSCSGLTSITIPDKVTTIGDFAFGGCSGLTSVTIGNSVTEIYSSAFSGCSNLTSINLNNDFAVSNFKTAFPSWQITSITLGNGVTQIGEDAFSSCYDLTSVTIPASVTSIGDHAFDGCSSLISVTIPDGVETIGDYAFSGCSGLSSSIIIPGSVKTIGYGAFSFDGFASFQVAESNQNYASFDGILYSKDFTSMIYVPNAISGNITLHEGLTSIKDATFSGCSGLTSINIPDSVTSIIDYAFQDCSALTSVTIGSGVTEIGYEPFASCSELASLTYRGTSQPKYGYSSNSMFRDCKKLAKVDVPLNYNGNYFFSKPVNKVIVIDPQPSEGDTSIEGESQDTSSESDPSGNTGGVDTSSEDNGAPVGPPGDSNKGGSNAGVIAGSVVAAVAVVAAVVVTAVMYVKKLACFARAAASVSEGGAPAEDV